MDIEFKVASVSDAAMIGKLVMQLTTEICERTNASHFDIDLADTIHRCEQLISDGHYGAVLGFTQGKPVAVSTFTESYALYAGGKIGIIPEFYVDPIVRSLKVGAKLLNSIKDHGKKQGWSCIELCTPPLPEFDRTLSFYQNNGLVPVGGRKMRQNI